LPTRSAGTAWCAATHRREVSDRTEVLAAREMRDGPSGSDGRVRAQTTGSCFGTMAGVVSVLGKRRGETRQVSAGKTNVSEPSARCRKPTDAIETRLPCRAWEESGGWPACCPDGGRHRDGVSPAQALVRNAGTCTPMPRETSKRLTREEPSTDAGCRGGRARGSDEAW